MWAYYGNHRGCCVEYDVSNINGIKKVDYVKEFNSHEDMNNDEVLESLYKKGNEWAHENEYRIVYYQPSENKGLWKIKKDDVFLKASVKKIVFGYLAEKEDGYYEALEYLNKYNSKNEKNIEIAKCKMMKNKYQLEENKQFDIELELLNK